MSFNQSEEERIVEEYGKLKLKDYSLPTVKAKNTIKVELEYQGVEGFKKGLIETINYGFQLKKSQTLKK